MQTETEKLRHWLGVLANVIEGDITTASANSRTESLRGHEQAANAEFMRFHALRGLLDACAEETGVGSEIGGAV